MQRILNYINKNKHCLLLLYWPIHFIWYELLIIQTADREVLMIHSSLDDMIPFCEWFIIPYVLWYFYITAVLIYSYRQGKTEFLRADFLVSLSMLLPMIFCTIVPNGIDYSMRPDFAELGRENWAIELVKSIYEADSPPRNVMPSMHVSVSWALMFAVLKSDGLKGKRIIKILSCILSILVTLSTVFIKQHSVLDVFAGIGVALAVFAILLAIEKTYKNKEHSK